MVDKLTNSMLEAKAITVPTVKPTHHSLQIPADVLSKIQERNALRRRMQRNPHLRTELTAEVRRLQGEIKSAISCERNKNFGRWIEEIPEMDDTHKTFRVAKLLKNKTNFMPPLKSEGRIFLTPFEKSELLADQFEENYANPLRGSNISHTRHVESRVRRYFQHCETQPEYVRLQEVEMEVRRVKRKKAPGDDDIHN